MTVNPIIAKLHSYWAYIIIAAVIVVYMAINLFVIGGDQFVLNLNNDIIIPLAIGITVFSWALSRQISASGRSRLLWWGLTVGWALWLPRAFPSDSPAKSGFYLRSAAA